MKKTLLWILGIAGLFALSLGSAVLTVNLGSRGEETVMPDLRGLGIVAAMEALEKSGLSLKINGKEHDEALPAGVIISHLPGAGGMVRKGRSVEAIVSVGPRRVSVPDVRGTYVLQAQSTLLENSLKIGLVTRVPSRQVARDTVVAQAPSPPLTANKNAPVDLLVSSGPPAPLYVTPDFIGRALAETVRLIQDAGLELDAVTYEEYPGVSPGTIIGQKPLLGTPVGRADRINLSVARGKGGDNRKARYSLLSFYVPEGLRPRRVRVEKGPRTALDETKPAGERVQVLVETDGRTKALIYVDDRLQDTRFF
jgi:beta-lactam-binding protein with PASTA domain